MKTFNLLSRAEMKQFLGGVADDGGGGGVGGEEGDLGGGSGTCGVNIYSTHGDRIMEYRGLKKADAISQAQSWNTNHQSYCTTDCNAVAKWCCASC